MLYLENFTLCRRRLDALAEERAALSDELRRRLAATADQGPASGGGGSGGDGGGRGGGGAPPGAPDAPLLPGGLAAGDAALHELVADLGANSRRELWTLVPHYLVNLSLLAPAQLARGLARMAPWQGNAARLADAVRHLLVLRGDDALLTAAAAGLGPPLDHAGASGGGGGAGPP